MQTVYMTPHRSESTLRPHTAPHSPTPLFSPRMPNPSTAPLPRLSFHLEDLPPDLLPRHLSERLSLSLAHARRQGCTGFLEEIRLRADRKATLTVGGHNCPTDILLAPRTLSDLLIHLCGGSLYAYSDTIHQGFLTLPGGIRVGVAGRAVCEEGRIIGVTDVTSLCIRLPHPHRNVGGTVCRLLRHLAAEGGAQGVLIYAPPGVGKTTLLRAVAATMASGPDPWRTVVVDTRGELGFAGDRPDLCLDVLAGYPRARGVEIATRTLSAQLIVCDEIGDVEEAMALISAHHGGVPLVASAHAGSVEELLHRTGIRLLHEARLFGAYVGIRRQGDDWAMPPPSPQLLSGALPGTAPTPLRSPSDSRPDTLTPLPLGAPSARGARLNDRPDDRLCDHSDDRVDPHTDNRLGDRLDDRRGDYGKDRFGVCREGRQHHQNRENGDFHRERNRAATVAPPCKTGAQKPPFSAKMPVSVAESPRNSTDDASGDYLYRITPWADAERLTGGA